MHLLLYMYRFVGDMQISSLVRIYFLYTFASIKSYALEKKVLAVRDRYVLLDLLDLSANSQS